MTFISIDLGRVEDEVERAKLEYLAAEERVRRAQKALDDLEEARQTAERGFRLAEQVYQRILDAAVGECDQQAGDAEPDEEGAMHLPRSVGDVARAFSDFGTRKAVLTALRETRGTVYALDDLVAYMKERGFTGSHNAVHVQLSRIIASGEEPDIERVRTGFYRAADLPDQESAPGSIAE